jgi:two-component system OmpR family response regulator
MQRVALVVDDEPLVLLLVSAILKARGWQVLRAASGGDALAMARGVDLDLLITDAEMPGMDGDALARRLRADDPDLPILVMSGRPEATDWAEGVRHDFLAKPFGIEELAARVERLTGQPMDQSSQATRG